MVKLAGSIPLVADYNLTMQAPSGINAAMYTGIFEDYSSYTKWVRKDIMVIMYISHAPTANSTKYHSNYAQCLSTHNQYCKNALITDQDHLLEVLYVNIRHVYENTLLQQMIMIRRKWEKQ